MISALDACGPYQLGKLGFPALMTHLGTDSRIFTAVFGGLVEDDSVVSISSASHCVSECNQARPVRFILVTHAIAVDLLSLWKESGTPGTTLNRAGKAPL